MLTSMASTKFGLQFHLTTYFSKQMHRQLGFPTKSQGFIGLVLLWQCMAVSF